MVAQAPVGEAADVAVAPYASLRARGRVRGIYGLVGPAFVGG